MQGRMSVRLLIFAFTELLVKQNILHNNLVKHSYFASTVNTISNLNASPDSWALRSFFVNPSEWPTIHSTIELV